MRILYILWDSYGTDGIIRAFRERGDIINTFPLDRGQDMRLNEGLAEKIIRHIADKNYELVFSYNYFPVISLVCNSCNIKYAAWVYDSPLATLYSNTIRFPQNYVFIFDKGTYIDLKRCGVDTVYYLPLAADVECYDKYQTNEDIHKIYDSQISFVGSTYMEKRNQLYKKLQTVSPYVRGYLEGIMKAQKEIYGALLIEDMLTPDIMSEILKAAPWTQNIDGFERASWVFAHYYLARHIAAIQREEILDMLSEIYQVVLYTYEQTPSLPKVDNRGLAGYNKETIYIYRNTKINLNITLRSIISGIPLRAFEIIGSGGFLLTNYQKDFGDCFLPGEDFVFYENNEDLMEKADYYLNHERERKEIARNGYEKVKAYHTYKNRVEEIIKVVMGQ